MRGHKGAPGLLKHLRPCYLIKVSGNMILEVRAELDPGNPVHSAFVKWYEKATPADVGRALAVGCYVLNNALEEEGRTGAAALGRELSERLERANAEAEARVDALRRMHIDNIRSLKDSHEAQLSAKTRQHSDELMAVADRGRQQAEQWVQKYEEATKQYNEYIKEELSSTKDREIAALKERLSVIESGNAYKGASGESTLRELIGRRFPAHEVKDTSAMNGMSDIHVVDEHGYTIVVESKNKATITAQDVAKSTNDIRHVSSKIGDRFVGYLFVSLRSRNIPRKGELCYELVEGRPCIWYGCGCPSMLEEDVAKLLTLLWQHRAWHSEEKKEDVAPRVNAYMERVCEIKKGIEGINRSLTSMKAQVLTMQGSLSWLYEDMCGLVGNKTFTSVHACAVCGAQYKRKGDLERHVASKHASS